MSFLWYDAILNSGREHRYIWSAPWSSPNFLYIFARYYGIIYLTITTTVQSLLGLDVKFCQRYFWYYGFGGPILFTTVVNAILVLRIAALYKGDRKIILLLAFLFIGDFSAELLITSEAIVKTVANTFVAPLALPVPGCLSNSASVFSLVAWVPCLFVSLIFFLLTVVKFFGILRDSHDGCWHLQRVWDPVYFSPLFLAFVRDGSIFFFLVFSILLICTVTVLAIRDALEPVALPWLIAVYSFSGSHLVLNLREAAAHLGVRRNASTTMEMFSVEMQEIPKNYSVDSNETTTLV